MKNSYSRDVRLFLRFKYTPVALYAPILMYSPTHMGVDTRWMFFVLVDVTWGVAREIQLDGHIVTCSKELGPITCNKYF